jgi:uncharacterized protein GlcG (DUF336 family)
MPKSYETLTLEDAKRMSSAAKEKAASLGLPYNIAVVDAGAHLLAFVRRDPLFGIDQSNAGKVVIFRGGIPVTLKGSIFGGAVGAIAGTVEQDIAVA